MKSSALDNKRRADQGAAAEGRGDCACAVEPCAGSDCRLRSLLVGCSHPQRAFRLDLLAPAADGGGHVLQVISSSRQPEELRISASGVCGHGHPGVSAAAGASDRDQRDNDEACCPVVVVQGPGVNVRQAGNITLRVYPHASEIGEKSFAGFFERIFLGAIESNDYQLTTATCRGGGAGPRARIEAYGELSWNARLHARWRAGANRRPTQDGGAATPPRRAFSLDYAIDVKRDGEQWQLAGQAESASAVPDAAPAEMSPLSPGQPTAFPVLQEKPLIRLLWLFKALTGEDNKLALQTPDIRLQGNFALQEMSDDYRVRQTFDVRLRCAPLLAAAGTIDLVPFIKMLLPSKLAFIELLLREAQKTAGQQADLYLDPGIKLLLTLSGGVRGELAWQRAATDRETQCSGQVEGRLGFSLEPRLAVQGALLVLKVKAYLALPFKSATPEHGDCALSCNWSATSQDGTPVVAGKLCFTGLAWYGAVYVRCGVDRVEDRKVTGSSVGRLLHRMLYALSKGGGEQHKEGKICEIFAPFCYPAADQALPLGDFVSSGNQA